MARIRIDEDDQLLWFAVPDEWPERNYYAVLDLPDDKVEWIKRIAAEREAVQEYLDERMNEYYAARNAAREKEER